MKELELTINDELDAMLEYYYPTDAMEDAMRENGVSWSDFI